MTLTTSIAFTDPLPVERAWRTAAELVGAPDGYRYTDVDGQVAAGVRTRRAVPDQGCQALLWMHWSPDGPLGPRYWSDDDPRRPPDAGGVCLLVCVDNPVHHRTDRGGGAGDHHAWFAVELAGRLGVPAWVQDEYDGAWYPCTREGVSLIGYVDLGGPASQP